eukprot:SAG22_NODE_404_length_11005_cov_8.751788_16_plen_53_part_00
MQKPSFVKWLRSQVPWTTAWLVMPRKPVLSGSVSWAHFGSSADSEYSPVRAA